MSAALRAAIILITTGDTVMATKPKKKRAPRRKIAPPPPPPTITKQQMDEAIAHARAAVANYDLKKNGQYSVAAPPPAPRTHVYRAKKLPWWVRYTEKREPDQRIGPGYLDRWYLIPRNPFFNIYLHHFLHSDDDRACHDHPWINFSYLLSGQYVEHTIAAGGVNHRKLFKAGDWKFRRAKYAHRVELIDGQGCWTLFITGPRIRHWGFHCVKGWVHWKKFTDPTDSGRIGAGCGEYGDQR